MKLKPEHLETLQTTFAVFTPEGVAAHRRAIIEEDRAIIEEDRAIIEEDRAKDIEKRLRWDCLAAARLPENWWTAVYSYANDDHIDTALKLVMRKGGLV